ncbi:MAG: radical SAM protein [Desulfobacteraceae bacterium]|jgi:radical SAM protein with 4Fe4S-binding SPASM domain
MEHHTNRTPSTGKTDLIEQIRDAGLHPPETMTLMVTDGCNLHCRHCWLDCKNPESASPVAAPKIRRVINAFTKLGGSHITLTGGEFLSHPDWHAILQFCLQHAGIDDVCLQTNATLISRKHVEVLQELNTDKLTIQVSLDGAHPRTHDLVRGSGSYFGVMAGLRLLVGAGLGPQTRVAFTEMAHNMIELPELLENIDKMGIERLVSFTLVKGGRAAASTRMSLPTPVQYWELIHLYQNDAVFKKLCDQKATIAAIEWFKNRMASSDGNCKCLKSIFVDAQGLIYPCTMLLLDRYASQSAYSRPMGRVIQKALARWRKIPIVNRKRQRMLLHCARCPGKNHCRGGCMGRAATARGKLMGPEDRCSLRKAVYHWTMLPTVESFCSRG